MIFNKPELKTLVKTQIVRQLIYKKNIFFNEEKKMSNKWEQKLFISS